jgi:hypothetical protein
MSLPSNWLDYLAGDDERTDGDDMEERFGKFKLTDKGLKEEMVKFENSRGQLVFEGDLVRLPGRSGYRRGRLWRRGDGCGSLGLGLLISPGTCPYNLVNMGSRYAARFESRSAKS